MGGKELTPHQTGAFSPRAIKGLRMKSQRKNRALNTQLKTIVSSLQTIISILEEGDEEYASSEQQEVISLPQARDVIYLPAPKISIDEVMSHPIVKATAEKFDFACRCYNEVKRVSQIELSEVDSIASWRQEVKSALLMRLNDYRLNVKSLADQEKDDIISYIDNEIIKRTFDDQYQSDLVVSHTAESGTHVTGDDTYCFRKEIKEAGFRWKPRAGYWGITNTVGNLPKPWRLINMATRLVKQGLKVKIEIEDISGQEYKEERIIYLEKRAQLASDRAEKASQKSDEHYQKSKKIADMIPFGQPILVGHHSEKRHRSDQKKIHGNMDKSVSYAAKAERLESTASSRMHRADKLRAELEIEKSGLRTERVSTRKDLQELIRKQLKKISPLIKSARKDCEGKGKDYWGIYSISFHSHKMDSLGIHLTDTKIRLGRRYGAMNTVTIEIYDDVHKTFEKVSEFISKYIELNHEPVQLSNDKMWCKFDIDGFSIRDKEDQLNLPSYIDNRNTKKDLIKVFGWAQAFQNQIKEMSYGEVIRAMKDRTGVTGHSYCAMD